MRPVRSRSARGAWGAALARGGNGAVLGPGARAVGLPGSSPWPQVGYGVRQQKSLWWGMVAGSLPGD